VNTRHTADRLRTRLDLAESGSWPDDCLSAFLRYEDDPEVDRRLRESVFRRRLELLAELLPAHLDAADPTVRRDCLALLDLLADAPRSLIEDVLTRPSLEPWLRGTPDATSAAGLGGLLAAAQCERTGPVVPWSALVAPLHLGRLVVAGDRGTVAVDEDGTARITTAGGTVEFDRSSLSSGTARPMISGTTLSFILPKTRHSGFVLDGFDTRLTDGGLPTERLAVGLPRARRWVDVVDSGSCLLALLDPAAARQVDRTLRVLIPYHQLDGRKFGLPQREMVSSTADGTVGAFGISLGDEDPVRIAEALVREHGHTRLRALLWERPMHGDDGLLYEALWCRQPRPISGLVQGIAAFTLATTFLRTAWTAVTDHRLPTDHFATGTPDSRVLALATTRRRSEVLHGISQALAADELLPFGRRFLSMAHEVVSAVSVDST
jgi:HEXXH motif-containing protein